MLPCVFHSPFMTDTWQCSTRLTSVHSELMFFYYISSPNIYCSPSHSLPSISLGFLLLTLLFRVLVLAVLDAYDASPKSSHLLLSIHLSAHMTLIWESLPPLALPAYSSFHLLFLLSFFKTGPVSVVSVATYALVSLVLGHRHRPTCLVLSDASLYLCVNYSFYLITAFLSITRHHLLGNL